MVEVFFTNDSKKKTIDSLLHYLKLLDSWYQHGEILSQRDAGNEFSPRCYNIIGDPAFDFIQQGESATT